ncbi:exopolygalacturonase-like [Telopea speciosissima]|uniref:exopolygalacturonase-like n=1 Tax=Telopea speciosissima TaxID=54955 RepID=UPI001CC3F69C|nr:exopolygalacturonase-like [Telopea speciosissima]
MGGQSNGTPELGIVYIALTCTYDGHAMHMRSFTVEALSSRPFFNVINYGAKADGRTDISQALTNAWKDGCASNVGSTVLIPKGTYFLGPVLLVGPCRNQIELRVEGTVVAPMDPAAFKSVNWVGFRYINGLTISGGGTFDGKGQIAWTKNDCHLNSHCQQYPVNLRFDFLNNTLVKDITSLNSKNFHMNVYSCQGMTMQNLKIIAPGNSPNTDGIHIGVSSFITITHSVIGTGDDCISLGPGSRNITITNVFCGPGHGISVGSLGKYPNEEDVVGITVRDCILSGTSNGVRIKTWPSSPPGLASDLTFENIIMKNVYNPVVVDQEYCPYSKCDKKGPSLVKLKNIKLKNIRGTSSSNVVANIVGSRVVPCELEIGDINLLYYGKDGSGATSICSNAKVVLSGRQNPPTCKF